MATCGQKQWAVVATKPKWSKPRFVWEGAAQQLLVYASNSEARDKAVEINRHGDGMLYPKGGKAISDVIFKAMPVWTETIL